MPQLVNSIPAVWVFSTLPDYNALRADGYGLFLTPDQQAQAERIRQADMIFAGRHREYFLWEGRTQFDNPQTRAGFRVIQRYLKFNVLRLVALKQTDLLLGEMPRFKVQDPLQQYYLEALAERTGLQSLLYTAALQASYQAAAAIEAVIWNGETYLEQVPMCELFPVGSLNPDGQYSSYQRLRVTDVGTSSNPIHLLLRIVYKAGSIERQCFQLNSNGGIDRQIGVENWPMPDGAKPLAPLTITGIAQNTITWVPNFLIDGQPVSDFDSSLDLQDMLNAKQTQLADVIAKHTNPKLAVPQDMGDLQGNVRSSEEVFYFRNKDEIAKYIELGNSQIEAAMKDRDTVLAHLLVDQEMSPVLLGLHEGNHNDAYKKVKVQCITPLKKAERKGVFWRRGIKRMLGVVQDLECTLPGYWYNRLRIGVELNDGIPSDELEEAQILSAKRGAGVISLKRSIELQIPEPAAAAEELEEIQKENEANTPSVFMGTAMPGSPQGDQGVEAGEETAASVAAEDVEETEVAA